MKSITLILSKAAFVLLVYLTGFMVQLSAQSVSQNQTDLAAGQPYGLGTVYQRLVNVLVTTTTASVPVTNVQFTLTNPDQIARVSLVQSSNSLPDFTVAANFLGTPLESPGTTVNFTGSYTISSAGSRSFYLLVDIKPTATAGTIIDAVCTSVTTGQGTFTPSAMTNDRNAVVALNLTGTKTVSATGNYQNLNAAIIALNNLGVGEGGVTFEVADNQTFTHTSISYNIALIRQTGTATKPIVIKRSGTGSAKPIINCAATGSAFDCIIGAAGVDYLTIDGLDLRATGTSAASKFERPIFFTGRFDKGNSFNEVKNCEINAGDTWSGGRIYAISFVNRATQAEGTNNFNKIHHNTISNTDAGIDFNDNTTLTFRCEGNEIYNNTLTGQFATQVGGIKLNYCKDTKVYNNVLDGAGVTTAYAGDRFGIATNSGFNSGYLHVYGNVIKNMSTNSSGHLYGILAVAQTVLIYNNMVSNLTNNYALTATKNIIGIAMSTDNTLMPDYYLYHNSVYLNQTATNSFQVTAAVANTGGLGLTGITMINNIFVNTSVTGTPANNFVVYLPNKALTDIKPATDYNLYYGVNVTNANFKFGATNYANFDAYKSASANVAAGRDQHSATELPPFVSISDLHLTSESTLASNTGKPLSDLVPFDIDGNQRSSVTPDLGADELRVGPDGALNKKPTIDQIQNPEAVYITSGSKTIELTGITDGNPEREETITITAKSSNENVVANSSIQIIYNGGSTATLQYTPLNHGVTTITVTVKDDRGVKDIGDEDTNTMSFNVVVINPAINNAPTMGIVTTKIYPNRGQQVIVLPNINDGDDNKVQNITISVVSKSTDLLTVDSVSYKTGNKVAFVYVKDKSKLGKATLEITLTDNGGTADGGVDTSVFNQDIDIISFNNPCANFVEYDVQHWQPRPTIADVPTAGSYQKICSTNTPIETKERDFFWTKMYGYIVPSVTEYYNFQGFSNEGFHFFLNLGDGVSTNEASLTKLVEGATTTWTSDAYLLEAGKVYYFEAYSRDVINSQPFWIKWSSNSTPLGFISGENLAPYYDVIKPSTPQNFKVSNLGVNDITVSWNVSTDNRSISGYRVFLDGVLVNNTLIKETEYKITGLKPNSTYNIHVVAVDDSENSSYQTQVLSATTYSVDNIPPTVPVNLKAEFITAFSVKLVWNKSTDNETSVRGYNVYQNNVLVRENLNDTTVLINNLIELSNYTFTLEAVDANYNKSAKSASLNVSTIAFDPNETRDGIRKGRLSIKLNPLCKFDGFGVGLNYRKSSMISNNFVSFGDFEGAEMDTLTNVSFFGKAVSNATFTRAGTTITAPYEGKYSARISGIANGYFRCILNTQVDKQYTYLVRFAMKKDVSYLGDVQIKLAGRFNGTFGTKNVTPTSEWQMYELELTTTYSGVEGIWYLDFISLSNGAVFYDNIQFVEKGAYTAGEKFNTRALSLLQELKPSAVRWGAIEANSESFKYCSGIGTGQNHSYADWVALGNKLNAKTYLTTGVSTNTDFMKNSQTFKTFVEYLAGDASTTGGALRVAEGYNDLMSKSKGVIIELGNEVWGAAAHNAPIGADYTAYGAWARSSATLMKSTAGFDASKMKIAYSGRYPGNNYGLHAKMLTGDKGEVDILSISGYLGGNLNLDPNIPLNTSQLDYHKSGIAFMQTNFNGLKADWREMLAVTGRILPMYMYEGNMTTNSYSSSVGQAITFADYYASMPLFGVPDVCIFNLDGGQWRLIDNAINYKPMPLYTVAKYINTYCTGTMLETQFSSAYKISSSGTVLDIDAVGCKAYTDSTSYSVALFSRDFENDYVVQVDIPDFIGNSTTCKVITITGNSFSATETIVDEKMLNNFKDSILVTVPKYGLTILKFEGADQHFTPPAVYQDYKRVSSVKLTPRDNIYYINRNRGRLTVDVNVLPLDAFSRIVKWELLDNQTVNAFFTESSNSIIIYATGLSTGNGTIRVVASATDLSGASDTISIVISNQGPAAVNEFEAEVFDMYPNPAKDYLRLVLPYDMTGQLFVTDLNGKQLIGEAIRNKELILNVQNLRPGVYLLRISAQNGTKVLKFVKQ